MKLVFSLILITHGFIHVMDFMNA